MKKADSYPSIIRMTPGSYMLKAFVDKKGRVKLMLCLRAYSTQPQTIEWKDASATATEGFRRLLESPQPVHR